MSPTPVERVAPLRKARYNADNPYKRPEVTDTGPG